MTICKFFARGNCRKGDYCTFEHVIPDENHKHRGGADGGGTSVLKRNTTNIDNRGYDAYHYDRRYDNRRNQDYYDRNAGYSDFNSRNVDGHCVTVKNDYYSDQQGNRSYDQRHQYSPPQKYQNDRFHYDSRYEQNRNQSYQNQPDITIDELYSILKADINSIEKYHIWPLTSFCVTKTHGSLQDWLDYSPEELRFAGYLAKAMDNLDGYKTILDRLLLKAQSLREFYKCPTKEASAKLKAYMKQETSTIHPIVDNELDFSRVDYSSVNFISNFENTLAQAPLFNDISKQNQNEDMEMAPIKSDNDFNSPVNSLSSMTSNSAFNFEDQAKQTSFSNFTQNVNNQPPSSNIFGSFAGDPTTSLDMSFGKSLISGFMNRPPPLHRFPQKSDSPETPRDLTTLFPSLLQTDLDLQILSYVWRGESPFTQSSELTEEDFVQFQADNFVPGKIPLLPPSKEMC